MMGNSWGGRGGGPRLSMHVSLNSKRAFQDLAVERSVILRWQHHSTAYSC